jgi:hypothetical protein
MVPRVQPANAHMQQWSVSPETASSVAAHLTCVNASRAEIDAIADSYWYGSAYRRPCAVIRRKACPVHCTLMAMPAPSIGNGLRRVPMEFGQRLSRSSPRSRQFASDLMPLWRLMPGRRAGSPSSWNPILSASRCGGGGGGHFGRDCSVCRDHG